MSRMPDAKLKAEALTMKDEEEEKKTLKDAKLKLEAYINIEVEEFGPLGPWPGWREMFCDLSDEDVLLMCRTAPELQDYNLGGAISSSTGKCCAKGKYDDRW